MLRAGASAAESPAAPAFPCHVACSWAACVAAAVLLATATIVAACGPPKVTPLPVLALGDSVMALAGPALAARGIPVDARQSRQFKEAIAIVTWDAAATATCPRQSSSTSAPTVRSAPRRAMRWRPPSALAS